MAQMSTMMSAATDLTHQYLQYSMKHSWLSWGLNPQVASFTGFFSTAFVLEWLMRQKFMEKYLIKYGGVERKDALEKTQEKVSWMDQFKCTFTYLAGPINIAGILVNTFVYPLVVAAPTTELPTLKDFAIDFVKLMFVADLFLYCGHRIAHEVPYFWKHHAKHHMLQTPTPMSTGFIAPIDAVVHAGPPVLLSGLAVHTHPVTYTAYVFWHLSNAAFNHCGLDCWWLDILTLKCLPLRTGNGHHDAHHQYENCGTGAKNFADTFWIWDWALGSYGDYSKMA